MHKRFFICHFVRQMFSFKCVTYYLIFTRLDKAKRKEKQLIWHQNDRKISMIRLLIHKKSYFKLILLLNIYFNTSKLINKSYYIRRNQNNLSNYIKMCHTIFLSKPFWYYLKFKLYYHSRILWTVKLLISCVFNFFIDTQLIIEIKNLYFLYQKLKLIIL